MNTEDTECVLKKKKRIYLIYLKQIAKILLRQLSEKSDKSVSLINFIFKISINPFWTEIFRWSSTSYASRRTHIILSDDIQPADTSAR